MSIAMPIAKSISNAWAVSKDVAVETVAVLLQLGLGPGPHVGSPKPTLLGELQSVVDGVGVQGALQVQLLLLAVHVGQRGDSVATKLLLLLHALPAPRSTPLGIQFGRALLLLLLLLGWFVVVVV